MEAPEHPIALVAGPFRYPLRGRVPDVDPQFEPHEAELAEAPPGQKLDRAPRYPAPACRGRERIPDLALAGLEIEADDRREAEECPVGDAADREACARGVIPARLVPGDPARDELFVRAGDRKSVV